MPKMMWNLSQIGRRVRLLHEITFSVYFSLLIIWANAQSVKIPWVLKLASTPGYVPDSFLDPKLLRVIAVLWAVSAVVIFLCLRVLSRFSFATLFLRPFIGIVAVGGFPLGYLYSRWDIRWLGDLLLVVVAVTCALLYLYGKWPLSRRWSILLICLHFGLWSLRALGTSGPGLLVLWPGYKWIPVIRFHPDLIYPLLGFCSTLLWAAHVRQSEAREESRSPAMAG